MDFDTRYNKQKCEELRKIRVKMAEELGIPWVVRQEPCNFNGVCKGTCPTCYKEERALMDRLYELSKNKEKIFEGINISKEYDFFGICTSSINSTKKEDDAYEDSSWDIMEGDIEEGVVIDGDFYADYDSED